MALNNLQYDEIMRAYQARQLDRQHLINKRKDEIHKLAPEYDELNARIASANVERARKQILGDQAGADALIKEIRRLQSERDQILSDLNLPADYLNPPYSCPDCQDTGYLDGHRCHCLIKAAIDMIYRQSNLADILGKENFNTFSTEWYSKTLTDDSGMTSFESACNALTTCHRFVENFDSSAENLLIFGDTGVGKTFLTHCIAKELIDLGHSVIYLSAHELFEIFENNTFGKNREAEFDYDNIFSCDLLIIDDLGTEFSNSFSSSQFFICLNERLRSKKSTVISTNLNIGDIAAIYSERVSSRILSSYSLINIFGNDIRIRKRLAKKAD